VILFVPFRFVLAKNRSLEGLMVLVIGTLRCGIDALDDVGSVILSKFLLNDCMVAFFAVFLVKLFIDQIKFSKLVSVFLYLNVFVLDKFLIIFL